MPRAGMREYVQARHRLALDLQRALQDGAFELVYQPIVEVGCRTVMGFEGLVRWLHPERGVIMPAGFIPLAEETGLIVPLGEFVLRHACTEAARWPTPAWIAVNLSPAQFLSPLLGEAVIGALAGSGLDPRRLELEITEGIPLQPTGATLGTLVVQSRGVVVHL